MLSVLDGRLWVESVGRSILFQVLLRIAFLDSAKLLLDLPPKSWSVAVVRDSKETFELSISLLLIASRKLFSESTFGIRFRPPFEACLPSDVRSSRRRAVRCALRKWRFLYDPRFFKKSSRLVKRIC